ncbi:MAG: ABC transporter permease [Candidatus Dormiibacterota bacterium]
MFGTYVLRRCLIAIPVLFGVSILSYALLSVTAGAIVPGLALNPNITAADIARIRGNLGLNEPFWQQYLNWTGLLWPFGRLGVFHGRYTAGMLEGNFGNSMVNGVPVMSIISGHVGNTLELALTGMAIGILIAVPIGIVAARHHGGILDHALTALSVAGVAVPSFWLGLLLILVFAVGFSQWGLPQLPTGGAVSSYGGGGTADRIVHLVLPACVLAFGYLAVWSRYMRSSMLEVLSQDYMRTAEAKGMARFRVVYIHGLRNAFIPLVTLIGLELPNLFAGSAIIEIVFNWPGLGLEAYQSATAHDLTVVMALTTFAATMVILGNLVADILYAVIDPRIRYG